MRVVAQNLSAELTLVEKVWKLNVTKTYIFRIQRNLSVLFLVLVLICNFSSKVMTPNPECANVDSTLLEALHTMHDGKFLHLPVLDRGIHSRYKYTFMYLLSDCIGCFFDCFRSADGSIVACVDVLQLTHATISMVTLFKLFFIIIAFKMGTNNFVCLSVTSMSSLFCMFCADLWLMKWK